MNSQPMVPRTEMPVPQGLGRTVGLVMTLFGVALVAFVLWAFYRLWELNRFDQLFGWVALIVCGVIAVFCLLVGGRLLLNRPNRHGSLLSPRGWRILGGIFFLAAAALTFAAIALRMFQFILTPLLAVGFGAMCFRAASRLKTAAKT